MGSALQETTAPFIQPESYVTGVGMSVPERVVANSHFATYLDTSEEWIEERTGIHERRWAGETLSASELAEPACREALAAAGLGPEEIDGIIVGTSTPDYVFPSSACILQQRLGVPNRAFAFDLSAACSGFVYALVTADAFIARGQCNNMLVVGSELYSRLINPNDRSTCVLFGDGAGAIVLSRNTPSSGSERFGKRDGALARGIYASELRADGNLEHLLGVRAGSANPVTEESVRRGEHYLTMNGREVFRHAVRSISEVSESVVARAGFAMSDIDYFISHQANKRILEAVAKQLSIPEAKILMNVQKYGNTSAASLPILLAEASRDGRLKAGDLILLSAFGGGVTSGAVLLRW